jgi:ribose transport system substrate-binding protein
MAGKSILSIPTSSANPFTEGIELNMQAIAKQVGFKFDSWSNQGQPSQWVQGMDYAINQKFSLIDMLAGTNPAVLQPQIAAAKRAGIKTVSTHVTGMGSYAHEPGVTANMPIDYLGVGKLLADWVILHTGGKANVLVIESAELPSTLPEVNGIKQEFAAKDPSYKLKVVNSPIPEWSTKIPPEVEAAVASDPGLNYIIPIYDSMSQFVVAALQTEHKVGKIKIATFNGTPFVLGLIQSGSVEMDIGENLNWIAHGILDDEMRLLGGKMFVQNEHIPLYIFDKSNAATAGVPPKYSQGYGNSYIPDYNKLWGLTK